MCIRDSYYIDVRTKLSYNEIVDRVHSYMESKSPITLIDDEDLMRFGKYDAYVPESLLAQSFSENRLDYDLEFRSDSYLL